MNAPGSIFVRRQNYSAFAQLPKHKINSYHIKMEDDGSHGNDEVRWFILSNLSASKVNQTACIFCKQTLIIYDRYPLIEGTFFLSPVQHHTSAIPLTSTAGAPTSNSASSPSNRRDSFCKDAAAAAAAAAAKAAAQLSASSQSLSSSTSASASTSANTTPSTSPTTPSNAHLASLTSAAGAPHTSPQPPTIKQSPNNHHQQYINSVCMSCLEGWTGLILCRFCGQRWDGSHLILGSIYMFDIFASETCCKARVTCNTCFSPLKFALAQSQQNQRQQQLQQLHALTTQNNNKSINSNNANWLAGNKPALLAAAAQARQIPTTQLNNFNMSGVSQFSELLPPMLAVNGGGGGICSGSVRQRSRSYTAGRLASLHSQYSSLCNPTIQHSNNNISTTNNNIICNNKLLSTTNNAATNKLNVFNFFSHYSRRYKCDTCHSVDHHFVKPIETIFCIAK